MFNLSSIKPLPMPSIKTTLFLHLFLLACSIPVFSQEYDTVKIREGDIDAARRVRRAELNDPIRPQWHFTIAEGIGMPFDPNGAFFKDGVYHLWHLYQDEGRHQWQHLTSIDLFHWRWQLNDLRPHAGDVDEGIFSGNAFVAPDGNVVISYHGVGSGGNCVAFSNDKELEIWQKPKANPIANPGWDPYLWYQDNKYYMISGGIPVSEGKPNPATLYVGNSYKEKMQLVGNFLTNDMKDVEDFEDISCPDFFKIEDKWVLLCISHTKGARYYIGDWNGKQFKPQYHHRMNWPGGTFFAPETLLDDKGRRILWAWVLDAKSGVSSGTMSMPRVLTLSKDKKSLNIAPPKEVELLRYQPKMLTPFTVQKGNTSSLKGIAGNSLELNLSIEPGQAKQFGVKVLCSADEREQTPILFDLSKNTVSIDTRKSSLDTINYRRYTMVKDQEQYVAVQEAPFTLNKGEKLELRIFLDKSVLEVFINGRQCVTQVLYPTLKDAVNLQVFAEDAPIKVTQVKSWKLFPAMQW